MLESSGIGTTLQELLPRLIARAPAWRFSLLGDAAALGRQAWAGSERVRIVPFDAPIYSLREQWRALARLPRDADVLWCPHYNVPVAYRGRLVVTINDVAHLVLPEYRSSLARRLYARGLFRAVRWRAAAVVTPSHFTSDELAARVGIDRARLHRIPHGVAPDWFAPTDGTSPHPRPYLLFVGNLKPHKNLSTLFAAVQAAGDRVEHDVVVVGGAEGLRTADAGVAAAAARLGGRVHFAGRVSHEALRRYYAHAAVLVFPSLYEGFGLPPLEAMASGCPVIASRAASLPEVCGDAALYCDPRSVADVAAQIARVVGDAALREALRQRGRERARGFSWDDAAEAMVRVLAGAMRT